VAWSWIVPRKHASGFFNKYQTMKSCLTMPCTTFNDNC
jgi:hypothetical protein